MDSTAWTIVFMLLLYAVGLGLFLLEMFLPSGGLLGLAASVCVIYSSYEIYDKGHAVVALGLLALTLAYLVWVFRWGVRRMALDTSLGESDSTGADVKAAADLQGQLGEALSELRPAGVALIQGRRFDVVSRGRFIAAGDPVEVVETSGNRIVVRRARDPQE